MTCGETLAGLIVADDLTGACDTGHEFAARDYRTRVVLDPAREAGDADVLVVDTDSRYAPPDAAAESVRAAIETHSVAVVYKKVDSTLRGNIAAEVEAALAAVSGRRRTAGTEAGDAATGAIAVVAPASPATGRTTACGYHLVEGRLVTDTEPGQDPEKGPASARLPESFADATPPVEHIGIEAVARGELPVADRLRERAGESRVVTADATHDSHLSAIATGADRVDEPTVYVGSAGLAGHVALPDREGNGDERGSIRVAPPEDARGVLGVVGSVAPETLDALDAVPEGAVVTFDPETAVEDPDGAGRTAAECAREAIERDGMAVVTAATGRPDADRGLAAGEDRGLSPRETRDRVATALARTAAAVVEERQPRGLFLTGGDTAVAVLDALGAGAIVLTGEAVAVGVPLGGIEDGTAEDSALITKAGAFGGRETVVNCLDRLRRV